MNRIKGVQGAIEVSNLVRLKRIEIGLQKELERILLQEELFFFKQKASSDWVNLGDRNTTYYHARVNAGKTYSRINMLQTINGEWCMNREVLKAEAVEFFKNLYNGGSESGDFQYYSGPFPTMITDDYEFLAR